MCTGTLIHWKLHKGVHLSTVKQPSCDWNIHNLLIKHVMLQECFVIKNIKRENTSSE